MKRLLYGFFSLVFTVTAACSPADSQSPGDVTALPNLPVDTLIPPALNAPAVKDPQLNSFSMLGELDGWGITESALLRTNDGGISWHDVTPSGNPFLGYGAAADFLSAGRAILVAPEQSDPIRSGTFYRTEDGGATWTSSKIPFGASELRFSGDMQNGWALVSLGVGAGSNAIAIYKTTDGGATWEQTFTNDPTVQGSSDEIPLGGLKGMFVALNGQRAWVGGVVYSNQTFYLYRTDDGGYHWHLAQVTPPEGSASAQLSVEDIQFVTATTGFLSLQVTASAGASRVVYVTTDAGDTWSLMPAQIPNGRATDFVSETEGFIFDGANFQVTHDGAMSWSAVEPDILFGDSFMHMDFVNARTGWVSAMDPTTSQLRLYKTTDGGATWTPQ